MMRAGLHILLLASGSVAACALAAPSLAQSAMHDHSAHTPTKKVEGEERVKQAGVQEDAHDTHQGHEMPAEGAMDHGQMDHGEMDMDAPGQGMEHSMHGAGMDANMSGTMAMVPGAVSDVPGNAPPPPIPTDHAADRYFDMSRMSAARQALYGHSNFSTSALLVDRLEYRANEGDGGYAWEVQAWFGDDIDRLVIDSNADGSLDEAAERIELAAYWRHAIGPWFNLQAGVRHDFRPRHPQRTYALIGVEGLLPYMLEAQAQVFVSEKGDVHARLTTSYEQRITRSLMFEPEAELNVAFQDVPELEIGAGFDSLELSARLLYDRNRSFAPYVGVNWERDLGQTARWSAGPSQVSATLGVRALF